MMDLYRPLLRVRVHSDQTKINYHPLIVSIYISAGSYTAIHCIVSECCILLCFALASQLLRILDLPYKTKCLTPYLFPIESRFQTGLPQSVWRTVEKITQWLQETQFISAMSKLVIIGHGCVNAARLSEQHIQTQCWPKRLNGLNSHLPFSYLFRLNSHLNRLNGD